MNKNNVKLRNVSLFSEINRGFSAWYLVRDDGQRDNYFDEYVKQLIFTNELSKNTRKAYCNASARFIDYIIEVEKQIEIFFPNANKLSGDMLVEIIKKYPLVLAGADYTDDLLVIKVCKKLNLQPLSVSSQQVHISGVNLFLSLSHSYNIRMRERGIKTIKGVPLYSEYDLFPEIGRREKLSIKILNKIKKNSLLGGVISGGPKFKEIVALKPIYSPGSFSDNKNIFFDSEALDIVDAPRLITDGFKSYRNKAYFSFLMATGCRFSEGLLLTLSDIDVERRMVYLKGPPKSRGVKYYNGYFTVEQLIELSWKGRATSLTFMIEPFATMFWEYLLKYLRYERLVTNKHPFLWQLLKGINIGAPWLKFRNIRRAMNRACKKIHIEVARIHSIRHMYGMYVYNYVPLGNNIFGLKAEDVQLVMGHASLESTKRYAKLDIDKIQAAHWLNSKIIEGYDVPSKKEAIINMLNKQITELHEDIKNNISLTH